MKNLKKLFASVASLAILASTFPVATLGAASYSDELQDAYDYAYNVGITTQSSIDSANMYGTLTRAHMAKMMVNFAKEVFNQEPDTDKECSFTDLAGQTQEMKDYIEESCQMGLMGVGITAFNPNGAVTRAQFGTVLSRVLRGDENEGGDPYYVNHLKALKDAGIMNNISNPMANEIRGYVMLMMMRADSDSETPEICETPENQTACSLGLDTCPEECVEDTDEPTVEANGNLDVSLSDDTLASQKLPKGAEGVPAATYTVKADEDVTLKAVTLKRIGMDSADAVSNVAIFIDGQRASTSKVFSSTTDDVTINLSPAYELKAGDEVELVAKVTTLANAGAEFAISLEGVESTAEDVDGDFPIIGNEMEIGTATATTVTVATDGSVASVKVGNKQAEILKFRLTNGSSSSETVKFSSITLKEEGTVDEGSELENFSLYYDGEEIASTEMANGKYITFNLEDAMTIAEGKTEKFVVKADIIGGASKIISLVLDKDLDVTAESSKYGYVAITDNLGTSNNVSIGAGALTITTVEPTETEIRKDKDNVVLGTLKVKVNAGKDLELQKFKVGFDNVTTPVLVAAHCTNAGETDQTDCESTVGDGTGGSWIATTYHPLSDYLENVELYDSSRSLIYDLQLGATSAADADLTIPLRDAKETTFQVRADVKNVSVAGVSFNIKVDNMGGAGNDNFYVVELGEDNQITDIIPNSVSFKKIEGTTSAATVNTLPLSTAKSAVIGSTNVEIAKFEIEAGNSSDLKVKEIIYGADVSVGSFDKTYVSQVKLYKDSVSASNLLKAKSSNDIAAGDVTFDSLTVNVAKNTKTTFYVTVDVVNDATLANKTITARNPVAGDFTVEDSDNDDTTVTIGGAATARVVTINNAGSLTLANNTSDSDLNVKKNILAGDSAFVASFEATSTNESTVLKDFTIVSDVPTNFVNAVSELVLYKADKTTEIARKSVSSATTTFTNVNYALAEGSEKLYVKAITNNIGKDKAGAALAAANLTLTATKVEGKDSGKTITASGTPTFAYEFNVVPVSAIVSKEAAASTSLTAGAVLGKVKLTPSANSNTDANGVALKTYAKTIVVKASILSNLSDVKLELRKAGDSTALLAPVTEIDTVNGTITFDLSSTAATDKELTSAGLVYDIVVSSYTITAGVNGSIELSLDKGASSVAVSSDTAGTNAVSLILKDSIGFGVSTELK